MIYFIIILLTIYFSSKADLLYENITGVLILPEYRFATIIFIVFMAWFFGIKVHKVFKDINISKYYSYTIYLTSSIMTIGAISPYTLNSNDLLSNIHVYCSMLPCISFLIHLFVYFYYLKKVNFFLYNRIYPYYLKGIEFLMLLTIFFGRMNGYIEILYSLIVCMTLYSIEKNKKNNKKVLP